MLRKYIRLFPIIVVVYFFGLIIPPVGFSSLNVGICPSFAQEDKTSVDDAPLDNSEAVEFDLLPIGINVEKRNILPSTLVKGAEDGTQALNFSFWLIPWEDIVEVLQLKIEEQSEESWQITAPGLVTEINPNELTQDEDLGLAITPQQIETWFKVPTEFNLLEYAIVLKPPWLGLRSNLRQYQEIPVVTDGLPLVSPPIFSFTAIGNEATFSGSPDSENNPYDDRGNLTAIGSFLGGGWFISTNQDDLYNSTQWNIQEAQWWYQSDRADYIVGSQPTFWRGEGRGNFWGLTTIQRWGFTPEKTRFGGFFSPQQRLQANDLPRTITGEAPPGTLVQLVQSFGTRVVAQTLVNESGIYVFKNIPVRQQSYQVKLYADGLLSNEPIIENINFSDIPELLPKGASVLTLTAGARRETFGDNLFGDFNTIGAGMAYRYGLLEDITLGVGFYNDNESFRSLGEIFYQPNGIPLGFSVSALTGDFDSPWELISRLDYNPSPNFYLSVDADRFRQRMNLNWRLSRNLNFTATGNYDHDNPYISAGLGLFFSGINTSTNIRGEIGTNDELNWYFSHRWGSFYLNHRGDSDRTDTEISYNLSGKSYFGDGHSLILDYETQNNNNRSDYIGLLRWRYRSEDRLNGGLPLWEYDLGYGVGSRGSGFYTSFSTGFIPGLTLRLRYQDFSISSSNRQFIIDIFPRFNVQNGIRTITSERDFDNLRSQGGLWIKPFYDKNGNEIFDDSDEIFTEDANLLLILNNRPIRSSLPEIQPDGVFVVVPPDTYRLDLDEAGYPFDWTPTVTALAVKVVAGSYTEVYIPFVLSYTFAGTLTDEDNKPIRGARVEAIPENEGKTISSITNGAGVFFLENLKQGRYNLRVNGKIPTPSEVIIDDQSEPFQELNLKIIN